MSERNDFLTQHVLLVAMEKGGVITRSMTIKKYNIRTHFAKFGSGRVVSTLHTPNGSHGPSSLRRKKLYRALSFPQKRERV